MIRVYAQRDFARQGVVMMILDGDRYLNPSGVWTQYQPGAEVLPAFMLYDDAATRLLEDLNRLGLHTVEMQGAALAEQNRIEALQDQVSHLKGEVVWLRRQCQNRNQTITVQDLTHRHREVADVREVRVPEQSAGGVLSGTESRSARAVRTLTEAYGSVVRSAPSRGESPVLHSTRAYLDAVDSGWALSNGRTPSPAPIRDDEISAARLNADQ